MGKLTSWLRQTPVAKDAGAIEAAYLAHVDDVYGADPELAGMLRASYTLSKLGESPAGVLWSVDSGWGWTYVLDTGQAAEVFVAVARSGDEVMLADDVWRTVENRAGVDVGDLDLDELAGDGGGAALLAFLTPEPELRKRAVVKADRAQQYTLGIAYFADEVDVHGDFTDAAELERTAWEYMAKSRNVGVMHEDGTDGAGVAVESYIYRGPDWDVGGQVVKEGDWLLGVVWGDETWKRIERDELTGFSVQGYALRDDDEAPA